MLFALSLLILFGLIAAPGAASAAASDAALLWWTRVLPSLLPYLVASSLLLGSGVLSRLKGRASMLLLPLGLLGGYPVGARIAGTLYQKGALRLSDAQNVAALCNLPNPVFLVSVVSAGLFRDQRTALPLLLGIYGTSLLSLIPLSRVRISAVRASESPALSDALPKAIADGVRAILNIGGCLVFASVLGALLGATGVFRLFGAGETVVRAVLLGLFEMTSGVSGLAALPFSLPLRLALTAFLLQFGGVSVLFQSASALPLPLPRYCLIRLIGALLAAIAVYLFTLLFCPDTVVPTMASGTEMLQNGFDLLTVMLSCTFCLLFVFVFTPRSRHQKRTR